MKILIIGAGSFIGENFKKSSRFREINERAIIDIDPRSIDYSGYDVVLHLAAIVHRKDKVTEDEYRKVNTELPVEVAVHAKNAGVKQFIFISTVSVYGQNQLKHGTITENTPCIPDNFYGKSKLLAETELVKLEQSNFRVAIIRPPMVYGQFVKANMRSLVRLVDKFTLLPLAGAKNKRSFIAVENLVEYIDLIIDKNAGGLFLVSDPDQISTEDLVKLIAKYLKKRVFLFSFPGFIIKLGKKIKPGIFERLYGSFTIDNENTRKILGFKSKVTTEEGIKKMIEAYLLSKNNKK